jgi:hypothetical protein
MNKITRPEYKIKINKIENRQMNGNTAPLNNTKQGKEK